MKKFLLLGFVLIMVCAYVVPAQAGTYEITLTPAGNHDFDSEVEGYSSAPSAHSVEIKNTGDTPTGELTIALSGTNAGDFDLSDTTIPSIVANGTATFTVAPDMGLLEGTYEATVTISGASGAISEAFDVSFKVEAKNYEITLDPAGDHDFGLNVDGYLIAPSAKSVDIKNTGNVATGELTIALSGTNAGDFDLSTPTISSIAVSGDDTFTVAPKLGLLEGTYEATVTISGASGAISEAFDVSFKVEAKTYEITLTPAGDKDFGLVKVGYGAPSAHSVTITNSGNVATGALSIALSGANDGDFGLSTTTIGSIAVSDTATFTVAPKQGLLEGKYEATVTVRGTSITTPQTFDVNFIVSFDTPPTITTTTLPEGTVGIAYSVALTADGDTPITWSLESGSLPNGLSLAGSGTISGTPTVEGTYSFEVKAANAGGDDTKALEIVVNTQVISTNQTYPSDKNDVAAATGLNPDDLEERGGKVYLKVEAAKEIAKQLLGANKVDLHILPIFEAVVTPAGSIAEVKFALKGKDLLALFPDEINLIGMISPTQEKFLDFVDNAADFDDGKFTLLSGGVIYTGEIDPNGDYELVVFIKDGGEFDLEGDLSSRIADGKIISSLFLASENNRSGSGGCNTGYGYLAFAILGVLPFILKKKK